MSKSAIRIEGRREFSSIEAADRFCDELEAAGQDWYGCTANEPAPGRAVVSWGRQVELSDEEDKAELHAMMGRLLVQENKRRAEKIDRECAVAGREAAALVMAEAAGYAGEAARMFCLGFIGAAAKHVNPRALGLEPEFRAGRAAWGSAEGQREYRKASVAARGGAE